VQINTQSITSRFIEFLDSISYYTKNSKEAILSSYSLEIPEIELTTIINSNIIRNQDLFYWKVKYDNSEFLALNPLFDFKEFGKDRLEKTSRKINDLEFNFKSNWCEYNLEYVPLIVGGIKFAPDQNSEIWKDFSDSDWFIPTILFLKKKNQAYFVYNFFNCGNNKKCVSDFNNSLIFLTNILNEENIDQKSEIFLPQTSSNSFDQWKKVVNEALHIISEGLLSKVVLSREVQFKLHQKPKISILLDKLSERYPRCYTFAYQRGNSIFMGASPEKLAKISHKWIEIDALAGSAPRGKDDIEDIEMERYLLNSEKNLFEQRAVVNFIHNLLTKFSDEIFFDDRPTIRKLPNIQHLWTIMRAKLNDDYKILDLLMKLHPTPAICGDPWKIAKDFILEKEPHDRGLYSGNIGWFNFEGCGEFAVGIRTALIKDSNLYAYAGCGIVEGSEPKAEFQESEIKLKPILSLFVNEKVYQP